MVLMISYDLNGGERPSSYTKVKDYIERYAASSIRPLYSQWFIETSYSAQRWVDDLHSEGLIDADDRLFVSEVRRPYQGWLTSDEWAWLNARV
jgi:hypothetical protein